MENLVGHHGSSSLPKRALLPLPQSSWSRSVATLVRSTGEYWPSDWTRAALGYDSSVLPDLQAHGQVMRIQLQESPYADGSRTDEDVR